jgi:hypothetical protein
MAVMAGLCLTQRRARRLDLGGGGGSGGRGTRKLCMGLQDSEQNNYGARYDIARGTHRVGSTAGRIGIRERGRTTAIPLAQALLQRSDRQHMLLL